MIENLHDAFTNRISESTLRSRVEYGNYAPLVDHYHQNVAAGITGNKEEKEYYGVAKYYEAASFYKAFSTVGDTGGQHGRNRRWMPLMKKWVAGRLRRKPLTQSF